MKYESIKQATILMALDNGAINRFRPLVSLINDLQSLLYRENEQLLTAANEWLVTLSEDDLEIFVSGSDEEIDSVAATAPDGVDELFDRIFEEVL